MPNSLERRRSKRIPVSLRAVYTIEDETEKKFKEALTGNISEDGALIISDAKDITPSSTFEINIFVPTIPNPIITKGKAIRVYKNGKLYTAVAFTEISEWDKLIVDRWANGVNIDKILEIAVKKHASDVHIAAGYPPILRIHGELVPINSEPITVEEIKEIISTLLDERKKRKFDSELELDFAYINQAGRFRINILQEKGQLGINFRCIPSEVKGIKEWELPEAIRTIALYPKGLILVTGSLGMGKSTTLSAMIDTINKERKCIIVTLEEPIEYLFKSDKSIILQREIGIDTHSFKDALRHIVRQDANVVMIGELRDFASIEFAISMAETGCLVLTTLPTLDVVSSINRIIDAFPAEQQQFVRTRLAEVLRGIISQVLLPRIDKEGRIAATEILVYNKATANIIRKGNIQELRTVIEVGAKEGMHTLKSSLEDLYKRGIISLEVLTYAMGRMN